MKRKLKAFSILLLLAVAAVVSRDPLLRLYYRVGHEAIILTEAKRQKLSPHLVAAVIFTESRFRPAARSEAGAVGLMQLMPDTAVEMARKENLAGFTPASVVRPEVNIRLGARYLAELMAHFPNEKQALAAYNAGPTVVARWSREGRGIGYEETREYVSQVQRHRATLERLYPNWRN